MNDSLRGVIEDPDFTQPVTVRHDESADTNDDGHVEFILSDPVTMEIVIVSPESTPFEILPTGQQDEIAFAACAMIDAGLGEDDRVIWDDGFGEDAYRAVEVEPTHFDGDKFAWYRLVEDGRGDPSNDDDGDGGDGGIR